MNVSWLAGVWRLRSPMWTFPGSNTDGGVESGLRIRLTLQMDPLGKDLSCNFSQHPFYFSPQIMALRGFKHHLLQLPTKATENLEFLRYEAVHKESLSLWQAGQNDPNGLALSATRVKIG